MFVILQAYNASLNRMPTSLKLVCIQVKKCLLCVLCMQAREREREGVCLSFRADLESKMAVWFDQKEFYRQLKVKN